MTEQPYIERVYPHLTGEEEQHVLDIQRAWRGGCPFPLAAEILAARPVVRDPESWQAVAREGRRFA